MTVQNRKGWFCGLLGWALLTPFVAQTAPCDTIPGHFFLRDTLCADQILLFNGHLYDPLNPGSIDTLPGAAAGGGDSIIQVDLVFKPLAMFHLSQNLCAGDTLWVNGVPYHAQHWLGEEVLEGAAANGCDSLVDIDLTVLPAAQSVLADTLCPRDFVIINGQRYDRDRPSGQETLHGAAVNGCDSLVQIALIFRDSCISLEGFVYAPNAFRPEAGEGNNDRFYLSADAGVVQIRRLLILDRWGDLVFLRENFPPNQPDAGWDGRVRGGFAPPGVYVFRAELEMLDGKTVVKTGEIALVR